MRGVEDGGEAGGGGGSSPAQLGGERGEVEQVMLCDVNMQWTWSQRSEGIT